MLKFLEGLDADLAKALVAEIRNLWTHTSTALEGNSLTLGDTAFVIEEGLAVAGKPLRDHQEVVGHARAIDLIYGILDRSGPVTPEDLFALHRAVQTQIIVDIYQPVGQWKVQPNGTYAVTAEGKQTFIEYAAPEDIPELMQQWLADLNERLADDHLSVEEALNSCVTLHVSFVKIHPFFNGNGRLARLLANLPVLKGGYPPVVIPREERRQYLFLLAEYELATGRAGRGEHLLPEPGRLSSFKEFCHRSWQATWSLVEGAQREQLRRREAETSPDREG